MDIRNPRTGNTAEPNLDLETGCGHKDHSFKPLGPVGFHLYFSAHLTWPLGSAVSSALYVFRVGVILGKQSQH